VPVAIRFFSDADLLDHFSKHHIECGAATKEIYFEMAKALLEIDLLENPHIIECTRTNNDVLRLNCITNEFAVVSVSGIVKTYYIPQPRAAAPAGTSRRKTHSHPNNIDYFWSECRK
jgi:hypothetical protein